MYQLPSRQIAHANERERELNERRVGPTRANLGSKESSDQELYFFIISLAAGRCSLGHSGPAMHARQRVLVLDGFLATESFARDKREDSERRWANSDQGQATLLGLES